MIQYNKKNPLKTCPTCQEELITMKTKRVYYPHTTTVMDGGYNFRKLTKMEDVQICKSCDNASDDIAESKYFNLHLQKEKLHHKMLKHNPFLFQAILVGIVIVSVLLLAWISNVLDKFIVFEIYIFLLLALFIITRLWTKSLSFYRKHKLFGSFDEIELTENFNFEEDVHAIQIEGLQSHYSTHTHFSPAIAMREYHKHLDNSDMVLIMTCKSLTNDDVNSLRYMYLNFTDPVFHIVVLDEEHKKAYFKSSYEYDKAAKIKMLSEIQTQLAKEKIS